MCTRVGPSGLCGSGGGRHGGGPVEDSDSELLGLTAEDFCLEASPRSGEADVGATGGERCCPAGSESLARAPLPGRRAHRKAHSADYRQSRPERAPGDRERENPGERERENPGERERENPGDRERENPGDRERQNPGERERENPGDRERENPGDRKRENPEERGPSGWERDRDRDRDIQRNGEEREERDQARGEEEERRRRRSRTRSLSVSGSHPRQSVTLATDTAEQAPRGPPRGQPSVRTPYASRHARTSPARHPPLPPSSSHAPAPAPGGGPGLASPFTRPSLRTRTAAMSTAARTASLQRLSPPTGAAEPRGHREPNAPLWVEPGRGGVRRERRTQPRLHTHSSSELGEEEEEEEEEDGMEGEEEQEEERGGGEAEEGSSGVFQVASQSSSPAAAVGERRMSKRERNRLKSLRRRQRRRERWRQSQLQEHKQSSSGNPSSSSEEDEVGAGDREGFICAVCLDVYFSPYMVHPCSHVFCEPCLRTLARNSPASTPCPLCRTIITHVFFQKELNQTARTLFPKEYLSRKQNFQKASCAKWPLPSCRKLFRIFGGFQRPASPMARRQFPHGGYRLDALDLEEETRGWRFDMDMVIIYIYSVNWVIGFFIFCFLCYFFFPSF